MERKLKQLLDSGAINISSYTQQETKDFINGLINEIAFLRAIKKDENIESPKIKGVNYNNHKNINNYIN